MNKVILLPMVYGVCGIRGSKKTSCLINKSGKIIINQNKCAKINKIYNTFLIRGAIFLFYGLYNLILGLYEFNSVYNKTEARVIGKAKNSLNVSKNSIVYFIVIITSVFFSYLIFGLLPLKLSFYLTPKSFNIFLKRFIIAIIKCVIIYLSFLAIKQLNPFIEYYKFNSAIKNEEDKLNQVNFLNYFICSLFICVFVTSIFGLALNKWYSVFVNIFLSLLIFAISYEIFKKLNNNKAFNKIILPFYFLINKKPSQKEIKCVNIVLKELEQGKILKMEEKKDMSFSEAYVTLKEKLEKVNKFEESDLDFIFCEVLGKNRAQLKLIKTITKDEYKLVSCAVEKRCKGEPIDIIFGKTNFYGLEFKVTKDVLCPRMDTEILVEQVIKNCSPKTKVLDIGTGSGAIAVTIAKESSARVTAVDISDKALEIAKYNAKQNGVSVSFKQSNLFENVSRVSKFDIIVSNPPYIPSEDIKKLDEEVKKYDPILALDGGISGLDFYEKIIEESPKYLKPNGMIFFEVGIGQAEDVRKLLEKKFKDIKIIKDYGKIERVVMAMLK